MKAFEYIRPTSLEEACQLYSEADDKTRLLAGGTDLLVRMKNKVMLPTKLVSLRDVPGLTSIEYDPKKGLSVGSMVLLSAIEDSADIKKTYPAMAEAASTIGSAQIRNRATLGGNLCNASPAADMLPILIAFGATTVITDGKNDRTVPLEEFYTGPGTTVMKRGELLKKITVPAPSSLSFYKYVKTARSALDCSSVGVGAMVEFNKEKTVCQQLRLVLGAVSPTVVRAKACEDLAAGQALDDELIGKISRKAVEEINPITDIRCSAEYRKDIVFVNTRRLLLDARSWAEKGGKQ